MKRLILSATAAFFLCGGAWGGVAPVPVKTIELSSAALNSRHHYFGTVQASRRVSLSFRVPGPLLELPVETGQHVAKGQLIARIDPRDYKTRLAEAQSRSSQAAARHVEAQKAFRRYDELFKKNTVSQAQYDQYKTALDVARSAQRTAEAGVSAASNALKDTELRAPFSGVIVSRMAEQFQDVQPMQPIVSLQDLESVEIVVNVPEEDIATLAVTESPRTGVTAAKAAEFDLEVTVDALPDQTFKARFKEIGTQSDPRTRTYPASVVMPQPENARILPGMTVHVSVSFPSAQERDASGQFAVPIEALAGDVSGNTWVWRHEPTGAVTKIPVTLGEYRGKNVLLSGELKAGDKIVTHGARALSPGTPVRDVGD